MFKFLRIVSLFSLLMLLCPLMLFADATIDRPTSDDLIIKATYIHGTATNTPFDHYVLDYRIDTAGASYTTIQTDTVEVDDDWFGRWATGGLDNDTFYLRLRVFSDDTTVAAVDSVEIFITPTTGDNFVLSNTFGGDGYSGVANYIDYDGDNLLEIVYSYSSGLYLYDIDDDSLYQIATGSYRYPASIGDVDGDGFDDIIAFRTDLYGNDSILIISNDTTIKIPIPYGIHQDWEYEYKYQHPIVVDYSHDYDDEIFNVPAGHDSVFKAEYDNDTLAFNSVRAMASIPADLNGDGNYSLYVRRSNSVKEYTTNFNSPNRTKYLLNIDYSAEHSILSAYDVNQDDTPELILLDISYDTDSIYYIWAFDENLDTLSGWPRSTYINKRDTLASINPNHPVFADVNQDGDLEYFISWFDFNYGYIYAFNADDGSPFGDICLFAKTFYGMSISQPIITDIDGNGTIDIVASSMSGSGYGGQRIFAWDYNGNLLQGYPIEISDYTSAFDPMFVPMVNDFNLDGKLELFVPTTKGFFYLNYPDVDYDPRKTPVSMYRYHDNFDSRGPSYYYDSEDTSNYICGDANFDLIVNMNDAYYIIDYVFTGGPAPVPYLAGDANYPCDTNLLVNISDAYYLILYTMSGGNPPCECDTSSEKLIADPQLAIVSAEYIDGFTVIKLESNISLGAIKIYFDNRIPRDAPVSLVDKDMEMLVANNHVGFIDMQGKLRFSQGEYELLKIPGEYNLVYAEAANAAGFDVEVVTKEITSSGLPREFALDQNYPNPFNPSTVISFALPTESDVSISVYNILGQKVTELVNEKLSAGYHRVTWDGTNSKGDFVSSGVYFSRMKAGDYESSRKMILLK